MKFGVSKEFFESVELGDRIEVELNGVAQDWAYIVTGKVHRLGGATKFGGCEWGLEVEDAPLRIQG